MSCARNGTVVFLFVCLMSLSNLKQESCMIPHVAYMWLDWNTRHEFGYWFCAWSICIWISYLTCLVVTDLQNSQNHRVVEVGRDIWKSSGPAPCLGRDTKSHLPRSMSRQLISISSQLSGQSVPVLPHLHSGKLLPDVQTKPPVFQFVPMASGPVSGYHWKEPSLVLIATSLQVFMFRYLCTFIRFPLCLYFSRLNSLSLLSLSSYLGCILCWTPSGTSTSLLYWVAQNWTQCSSCGPTNAE